MTDFTPLYARHAQAVINLRSAQASERAARTAANLAANDLSAALLAHVKERFAVSEMTVEIRGVQTEIQIVDCVCHSWEPEMVRAVFFQKIKSGKWGKTRTTGLVAWDFKTDSWRRF